MNDLNEPKNQDKLLASARSLIFEITCGEMQALLASAGIPMLVLKGPHVGCTLYEKPDQRIYCDLDILVRPEHYFPAARVLLQNGFKLFSINRRRLASEKADYQLLLLAPRGVAIELHRALADRDQFHSDVQGFFQRAHEFSFGALKVRGLGTEDLLLHLCLHFGKRHFMTSEPKHLLDIALLLNRKKINWPAFLLRVTEAKCRIVTHYCLQAVKSQQGAAVPNEILAALCPGTWRRRLLEKYLDPGVFPIYRFPERLPGLRERMVNLLLLDHIATMCSSSIHFAARSAMNRFLMVRPLKWLWMKGNPLAEWIE